MMVHQDYKELLAASALTALDAEDARALDSHLESCADCRSEMREWEDTAAAIALSAKPLEPSALLRQSILKNARMEAHPEQLAGGFVAPAAEPKASQVDSKVLAFTRPQREVWTPSRSFGAIAAALVIAALLTSLLVLWQQNRATQRELASVSSEMQQLKAQLDSERDIVQLLTSPDAHMARLAGTNVAPGSRAMLAYDKSGHAMLLAKGLPAAPRGMAYQLWFITGGKPIPGKVFTTDPKGDGNLKDQVPAAAQSGAVFAVTLEPESGVQSPTGAIYLSSGA